MQLNLQEMPLYEADFFDVEKKITFVYGKNGTGKSTLVRLIKEQCQEYDVRIFRGFEDVLDENKRLNAVVLGEENSQIQREIEQLSLQLGGLHEEKQIIIQGITEPPNKEIENYWTRYIAAQKKFEEKEKAILDFCRRAASEIKNETNPQLSNTSYNIKNFQNDVAFAQILSEDEIKYYTQILKTDERIAPDVVFPIIKFEELLYEVNEILQSKVKERIIISRLDNSEKRQFAEKGSKIHRRGEVCAFCGNLIEDEVFDELESYFSVDEVKEIQIKIQACGKKIKEKKALIEQVQIDVEKFYPDFQGKVLNLVRLLDETKKTQIKFLEELEQKLIEKKGLLFERSELVETELPIDFSIIGSAYMRLKKENNQNDLKEKQKNAREKLKYHMVKQLLLKFNYDVEIEEKKEFEKKREEMYRALEKEKEKITGEHGIDKQISRLERRIIELQQQTKNEFLLAQNINAKLRHMVSFELERYESERERGHYLIKDIKTGKRRNVTDLSTGEKNIIAFLYFIEKLEEIKDEEQKDKIIVFDDPMNSNDSDMQYLIVEELQGLIERLRENEKFLMLTHNIHFYLNVKYPYKYSDKKIRFLHFRTNGEKTTFFVVKKKEQDFQTSYEALWRELIYLYENVDTPNILFNLMRRIVETYTKFNGIEKWSFWSKVRGAGKLFNVNSHSIDDLEADLCGKEKKEVLDIFCDCFYQNEALAHFKYFWPEYDTSRWEEESVKGD